MKWIWFSRSASQFGKFARVLQCGSVHITSTAIFTYISRPVPEQRLGTKSNSWFYQDGISIFAHVLICCLFPQLSKYPSCSEWHQKPLPISCFLIGQQLLFALKDRYFPIPYCCRLFLPPAQPQIITNRGIRTFKHEHSMPSSLRWKTRSSVVQD